MGFKENLKAELTYSGMFVKELAAASGIKKHTIDNYLNTHNAIPSAEAAVKIAHALGVSVEYLVTGREIRQTSPERMNLPVDMQVINQDLFKLNVKDRKFISSIIQSLLERNREG